MSSSKGSLAREFARLWIVLACVLAFTIPTFATSQAPATNRTQSTGPKIWLQDRQSLATHFIDSLSGNPVALGPAQPVALVKGDFDGDGIEDLAVGYATAAGGALVIYRGNLNAFAPQSEASFHAIERGEFPSPFRAAAEVINLPVRPDFVVVGSLNGKGYPDLLVAARGDSNIYLLTNNGKGRFSPPTSINVGGAITTVAAGEFGPSTSFSQILIGISGPSGSYMMVYTGTLNGLGGVTVIKLAAPTSHIEFGDFGDPWPDAAFLAGDQVHILRSSNMRVASIALPLAARSFALGRFLFDRNATSQIAFLAADGSVQIAARNEFDARVYTDEEFRAIRQAKIRGQGSALLPSGNFPIKPWKIVESFAAIGTVETTAPPVFFRTRISVNGADDIVWLNPGSGMMAVISHLDPPAGADGFLPGQVSLKPYSGTPLAAIPMRLNVDSRPGIVALHEGEMAPSLSMPIPDPTYTVNTTSDGVFPGACAAATPNQCTLREALLESNGDTVMVPAGTYTLTIAKVANDCTGKFGALSVNRTTTIVGAGQNSTIIQAGTTAYNAGTANGVDMVMNVNEDLGTASCPITNASASISNLTLQNGHNRGTHGNDGDGGCMEFDTGSSGTATLTLTNVALRNCDTTLGNGGGLASFNFVAPSTGMPTITNSIIEGNSAVDSTSGVAAGGGGIWVSSASRMLMSNSQVLNNLATQTSGTVTAFGGGLFIFDNSGTTSRQTVIHGSTISGNHASGAGAGIWDNANLLVDQGTTITNNVAGAANIFGGGGLYLNPGSNGCPSACTNTVTLSKVTVTGNSATGNGGGVMIGNNSGAGNVTISFSRIANNTSSANSAGNNLSNDDTVVTATNNWWGTNLPSSTILSMNGGATTFSPYIVLTHTASPSKIRINQSTTLTADLSKDSTGNAAALSGNLNEIVGRPVTFDNPVLGSIPQAQPETLNSSAQATATLNAGGTGGLGSVNVTVDSAVVAVNSSLISTATESGTTATITTVGAHGFSTGSQVEIAGVTAGGYNGTFVITSATTNTFTYTASSSGLGASSGGTATVGIIILEPPQITKTFGTTTIPINGTTTVNFSINNPNVVAINASFTDAFPVGLQVATTPSVSNTCGGTVTATAGSGSISFSNNLLPIGTCTISVNVTGTLDNNYTNSVQILSTDAGNGNSSSANLTVINPPHIAKSFGAATIPLNGTTALTFTIDSNGNQNLTLNSVAFTDNLPAGLVVANPSHLSGSCTGTVGATPGASTISLSGQSLSPTSNCTLSVDVQGTTAGVKNNSVQVTSTEGGTGNTSNASLTVVGPPTISKAFGAASLPLNGSTSLSFTIQNGNTSSTLNGVAFADILPAGLVVSTPNGLTGSCGSGTITATAGSGSTSLSGASLAANTSCTFSVNVTATTAGTKNNTTGTVTSTEGGTGGTASASLNVVAPPSIAKAFNPSGIPLNATTSLTFTITNPLSNAVSLTGVAFTDTLPAGLTVANATATICGGTLTAIAPTGIALSGATIASNSTCQFSVTVTGSASGQYTNTTGNVASTNGGTGNTASANLTVATPPSITKAFGAATIPLNHNTSLTFTVHNPNTTLALTGVAFIDSLPAGLVVASPPSLSNTCGGLATAVGGSSSVSLSTGNLAASASCTVSVNVTGTGNGVKNNSVEVTSTEGGTGNTSNASLTVVGPPTISKAFGAASLPLNGSTSLSFTIQNGNTSTTLTGVGFTDALPAGLAISTPNGLTGSCGGGTITATAASGSITLSGASLPASSSCTFSVNVTATAAGAKNNTTGTVASTEGGTGGTASASLNVVAPPSIAKVFNPSGIPLNATTSLTFTITNPSANALALTGVTFSDTLPTGLTVANATATVCGGTLTAIAPTGIALSGATIASNSTCQFSVTVTGAASGQYTNTTGNVTSTNGGTGNTASANLTVATPPSIQGIFGAATVVLNGSTTITYTIHNPNATLGLTGVAFADNLPAGIVVAAAPSLSNTCGGSAIAAGGSGLITLTGGTVPANASCSVSVNLEASSLGVQNNSVTITSSETGAGNVSQATITVIGPPNISKSFGAPAIFQNNSTSLIFVISNPNSTTTLTGVRFTDLLPAGLAVSTPNGLSGSCGGGTITATAASGSISLSGASLASSTSCTFSVNVVGTTGGTKNNATTNVSSTEAGNGGIATASIDVEAPDLTISTTHSGSFIRGEQAASYTIIVSNSGFGPTNGTVTVTDTLPNVPNTLVATAISGTGWSCTLATLTCTRNDALAAGSSYSAITLTANVPIAIATGTLTNTAMVAGGADVNAANNTATDPTTVASPQISIVPSSTSTTIQAGQSATFNLTMNSNVTLPNAVTLTCSASVPLSECVFSPNPAPVGTSPSTVNLTLTTTGVTRAAGNTTGSRGRGGLYLAMLLGGPMAMLLLPGWRHGHKRPRVGLICGIIGIFLVLTAIACGGGRAMPTTPTGTYQVAVTATDSADNVTATTNVTVVVTR